jgi:hypothetical protein
MNQQISQNIRRRGPYPTQRTKNPFRGPLWWFKALFRGSWLHIDMVVFIVSMVAHDLMNFLWFYINNLGPRCHILGTNGHAQGYKLTTKHALYRRSISLEWDMGSIRRFFA